MRTMVKASAGKKYQSTRGHRVSVEFEVKIRLLLPGEMPHADKEMCGHKQDRATSREQGTVPGHRASFCPGTRVALSPALPHTDPEPKRLLLRQARLQSFCPD